MFQNQQVIDGNGSSNLNLKAMRGTRHDRFTFFTRIEEGARLQ
jgi:hypothetical protein